MLCIFVRFDDPLSFFMSQVSVDQVLQKKQKLKKISNTLLDVDCHWVFATVSASPFSPIYVYIIVATLATFLKKKFCDPLYSSSILEGHFQNHNLSII